MLSQPVPSSKALYCPQCGRSLDAAIAARPNDGVFDMGTPIIKRRTYKCPHCATHYHASEWLDVHTDRLVYHLSQLARFFAHPTVASNLGTEKVDDQASSRGRVAMRVYDVQGKVSEYRGKHARLLWTMFSDRHAVELQAGPLTTELKKIIKDYDLPIRIMTEDRATLAVPEGAWHKGQVYGDENDSRYTRITFGLARTTRRTGDNKRN